MFIKCNFGLSGLFVNCSLIFADSGLEYGALLFTFLLLNAEL